MIIQHNSLHLEAKFPNLIREIISSSDPIKVQYLKICTLEKLPKYRYWDGFFEAYSLVINDEVYGRKTFPVSSICVCLDPHCNNNHKTTNICII